MKAKEFDKLFDEGACILDYADQNSLHHPNRKLKRVNIDFPVWMIKALDHEAERLGVKGRPS